jgi:mannose-6-phosphate isomerase-like protein (cupin superfamily)
MIGAMPTVVAVSDLHRSPTAALFEGGDEAPVSMFITAYPNREQGPDLHLHPYPEVFLVEAGTARFTAGDEQVVVEAGHVVVVPAETPHGFKNAGEGELRVVSVHPSPTVQQTDL